MENFTPLPSFTGGLLIGLAATILLLLIGRIAGISGIIANILPARTNETGWRLAFMTGLIVTPLLWVTISDNTAPAIDTSTPILIIGGLLVGFGTSLGSGCTSGHGVCGIGRFSVRSIIATVVFMAAAMITVFLMRHLIGG